MSPKIAILLCFLFFPVLGCTQIHSSLDFIGSFDFYNGNSSPITENKRGGYRFGGNFNFRIFGKSFVKTGIRYVRQGIVPRIKNNFFSEYEYVDEYYLEVPLVWRYEFNDQKFTPFIEAGIAPHFFLQGKYGQKIGGVEYVDDYEIPYLEGIRYRFTLVFGSGFNYKLSDKYQFFLESIYRYFLPIDLIGVNSITTRNIGIEFGIRRTISFVNDRN